MHFKLSNDKGRHTTEKDSNCVSALMLHDRAILTGVLIRSQNNRKIFWVLLDMGRRLPCLLACEAKAAANLDNIVTRFTMITNLMVRLHRAALLNNYSRTLLPMAAEAAL